MKTEPVKQAKAAVEPAAASADARSPMQRKATDSPRQAGEAAHIAQLKGEDKMKGKATAKKGKGGK
ncbi:hypothetical protein J2T07_000380 [Luteibacter jiangsuensis]|uniref:Uncharacterized protein n=1 Tax=Luteibacter jiangsuensis TaxID=637577 RepID=A0ABT9ST99_9GAMM|nr:hypothetical protein [Luteibacter jiangsuensis]MDQ0008221.1 hypothetical protein [Luteibacter jiangsuensis]